MGDNLALIVLTTYCTPQNQRLPLLEGTLGMLLVTVDWDRHKIVIVDNCSTDDVTGAVEAFRNVVPHPTSKYIRNTTNVDTARAFNVGHSVGGRGQNVLKLDDDVVVHESGWLETLELALERIPDLGGVSLKWRLLTEAPGEHVLPAGQTPFAKTTLDYVPRAR